MKQLVIVRPEGPERVTAQSASFPEIRATGASESEAVTKVREALDGLLRSGRIVEIDVPGASAGPTGNPWLDTAGRSKDDPTFQMYLAEMERARREDDSQ